MPHAYAAPSPDLLAWVVRQVDGSRVLAVERLLGGITADMDRITVAVPRGSAGAVDVVLRRWGDEARADELVAQEAAGLAAIRGHGVPAPELIATGERCTLTTALPGQPDLAPADRGSWVSQLAAAQAAIHGVPLPSLPPALPRALPRATSDRYAGRERSLAWIADPGLRESARQAAAGPARFTDEPVLVHGDYQHFNVLWVDGRLTGVVDWPHAGIAGRGTDVGHCRLNLAVLLGPAAAADHLTAYERAAGVPVDRRADLRSLLCFDREWEEFIPRQVGGRAPLDVAGMAERVAAAVRDAVEALG